MMMHGVVGWDLKAALKVEVSRRAPKVKVWGLEPPLEIMFDGSGIFPLCLLV
jgi:hypothetical protein